MKVILLLNFIGIVYTVCFLSDDICPVANASTNPIEISRMKRLSSLFHSDDNTVQLTLSSDCGNVFGLHNPLYVKLTIENKLSEAVSLNRHLVINIEKTGQTEQQKYSVGPNYVAYCPIADYARGDSEIVTLKKIPPGRTLKLEVDITQLEWDQSNLSGAHHRKWIDVIPPDEYNKTGGQACDSLHKTASNGCPKTQFPDSHFIHINNLTYSTRTKSVPVRPKVSG